MQLIRRLPDPTDRPAAVAIGNFDGLHRGHQAVISAMKNAARANKLVPTVLTFEPHPRRFFRPDTPLFRIDRFATKLARLSMEGVERCVVPRFDAAFAGLSAEEFMERVLAASLNAKVVVTGENFAFGKGRGGDIAMLKRWGAAKGIEIIAVPPVMVDGEVCSSSAVRAAINGGDMQTAARLLGRGYMLTGRVIAGDARGRVIGFPTANVALPPGLLLPPHGVYAVHMAVAGRNYQGVANFGVRPTVDGKGEPKLEVHVFDVNENLYGQKMRVFLIEWLREERKFDGIEALAAQIFEDSMQARRVLGGIDA